MTNTRERILSSTETLFRQHGYNGTSVKQVREASKATTGSIYHYYPGGKEELALSIIHRSGQLYQDLIAQILDGHSNIDEAVQAVFNSANQVLAATDYIDICPIGGMAREVASTNSDIRDAINLVFEAWITEATKRFQFAGYSRNTAMDLATIFVAALEGGFILARTSRCPSHLNAIGRCMISLIKATKKRGF